MDKEKCRKHAKRYRAKTEEALLESKKHRKDRKGKHMRCSLSSKSSMITTESSNASKDHLLSNLKRVDLEQNIRKTKAA